MKRYSLKFYADRRPDYLNKLFVFESDNYNYLETIVYKFLILGNDIRAAFLTDYQEEKNIRLPYEKLVEMQFNVLARSLANDYETMKFLKDFQITHKDRIDYMNNLSKSLPHIPKV